MTVTNAPEHRPTDERRADYSPGRGAEYFMLSFLRQAIETALDRHANTPGRALDVGCGAQPFRQRIEKLGYQYTGFDVVQNKAETVQVLGAIDAPLPPALTTGERFDLILCTEVLEHVADWSSAFANFKALLADRGRLIVTCPHFWPMHEVPYDFWRPTLYALNYHANKAGLKVIEEQAAGTSREVLYTALAGCPFVARNNKLSSKLIRAACVVVRRLFVRVLRSDWLDRAVAMDGKHYLSNFAVIAQA